MKFYDSGVSKELDFPKFVFESIVFVLYEMDAAAYGYKEAVWRSRSLRCCAVAGNYFRLPSVEPSEDVKKRISSGSDSSENANSDGDNAREIVPEGVRFDMV